MRTCCNDLIAHRVLNGLAHYSRQLKSRYRNAQLHLPFDIEVVMHAHLLHPRLYAQCCDRLFGETLGLLQETELTPDDKQLRMTQTLWHQAYGTDLSPDMDTGFVYIGCALTIGSQRYHSP